MTGARDIPQARRGELMRMYKRKYLEDSDELLSARLVCLYCRVPNNERHAFDAFTFGASQHSIFCPEAISDSHGPLKPFPEQSASCAVLGLSVLAQTPA